MVIRLPAAHSAGMEILNEDIVIQVIALLIAPLALITAALVAVSLVTGFAGRVVMLAEDLINLPDARRQVARRRSAEVGSRVGWSA